MIDRLQRTYVGQVNRGDEDVMGYYGVQERNVEGQMVLDCEKTDEMIVVNTHLWKSEEHRVTYKSVHSCQRRGLVCPWAENKETW